MITRELIGTLRERFVLDWAGIHGAPHWARVRANGLRLASFTGARTRVVEAFAFVHDACRIDDGMDPEHGPRAAQFARKLVRRKTLPLLPDELALLVRACEGHSSGITQGDITVCTCWDADRLDLGRIGVRPDPKYLCTAAARQPAIIDWAYQRSLRAGA